MQTDHQEQLEQIIDPGNLPAYFATPGLTMLRSGEFRDAHRFYQVQTEARPQDAHAWLGLGASFLAIGKLRQASDALLKGMALDTSFPLGALLAENPALQPSTLFCLTEMFVEAELHPQARECALASLSRCLAHPSPPHNVYVRADALRRKLCSQQAEVQIKTSDNKSLVALSKRSRSDRRLVGAVRVVVFALILMGLGVGSWCAYAYVQNNRLMRDGMAHYAEALQATARHQDGSGLYTRAFNEFERLATSDDFKANYMLVKCGQDIIDRIHAGQVSIPKQTVNEIKASMARATTTLSRIDPDGSQARAQEQEMQIRALRAR